MLLQFSRISLALLFAIASSVFAQAPIESIPKTDNNSETLSTNTHKEAPVLIFKTSLGNIEITLFEDDAPITVENFFEYVYNNSYDGTIFHRVIPGAVIQGGGLNAAMESQETFEPITNESYNGLKNLRGTLAMARTTNPDSATSQFFINLRNNNSLNATQNTPGYAVFGEVTKGMDVVLKISAVKTGSVGRYQDVPLEPVTIISVTEKY